MRRRRCRWMLRPLRETVGKCASGHCQTDFAQRDWGAKAVKAVVGATIRAVISIIAEPTESAAAVWATAIAATSRASTQPAFGFDRGAERVIGGAHAFKTREDVFAQRYARDFGARRRLVFGSCRARKYRCAALQTMGNSTNARHFAACIRRLPSCVVRP